MSRKVTARDGAPKDDPIEVRWELADLPSAQHRAGLAGLVLVSEWLPRSTTPVTGVIEVRADADGATLRVNREGMRNLFDELYAASHEENAENQVRKDKKKQPVPPVRTEEREEIDPKTGKARRKTVHIYMVTVPRGGALVDLEPGKNERGPWIKLWRNVIWSIFRGVPATRTPFQARADKDPCTDGDDAFELLAGKADASVELPSTYFLGAMARNAENVPFRDLVRQQFLLHFWPYAAPIYVPQVVDPKEGRIENLGFAIAVPEVVELDLYCELYRDVLRERGAEVRGYRPQGALVDLAVESGFDMSRRLRDALARREGARDTTAAVSGYEVVHVDKEGNNIRVLSNARISPSAAAVDEHRVIRDTCHDPLFRRQRLLNLVAGRAWWSGFDHWMETTRYKPRGDEPALKPGQGVGASSFCHDARSRFDGISRKYQQEGQAMEKSDERNKDIEIVVWDVVRGYVGRRAAARLGERYEGIFERAKGQPELSRRLFEEQQRIALDAFLQVRSRHDDDFSHYFVETLCSVPQFMNETRYLTIHGGLKQDRDKVRTLTLLALSAARWSGGDKKDGASGDRN